MAKAAANTTSKKTPKSRAKAKTPDATEAPLETKPVPEDEAPETETPEDDVPEDGAPKEEASEQPGQPEQPPASATEDERVRFNDTRPGAPAFDLIGRQARRDPSTKCLYWLLPKDLAERADRHNHVTTGRIARAR